LTMRTLIVGVLLFLVNVASAEQKCASGSTGADGQCAASRRRKAKKRKFRKEIKDARKLMRRIGVRPIDKPLAPTIPRVSVTDLDKPENFVYKHRLKPFILTGAMEKWKALERWQLSSSSPVYLNKYFRKEVVDFYPFNMLAPGTHPYLMRFGAGIQELMHPPGRYTAKAEDLDACQEGCRYLHLQLTDKMWRVLEAAGDLPTQSKRHPHTGGDEWWMRRCLADVDLRAEYHLKTHWKIILIGSQGAGMFNHSDSLLSASWHGHIQGRKWWMVCGYYEGTHTCQESVLLPGEILYYGKHWHHHTRNLETPTTTITGTVVTGDNFRDMTRMLMKECAEDGLSFDFSGKLCDALDDCYAVWHKILDGRTATKHPKWRDRASPAVISRKDKINPKDNNYDGRNYIGEEL